MPQRRGSECQRALHTADTNTACWCQSHRLFATDGGVGGALAVACTHPLVTLKTRAQAGLSASLFGRAIGAVIEVLVDHDEGTLSYRVNGGPLLEALKGETKFPKGAALRPFVACPVHSGDRVRLVTPYL